ncbi:MAG: hypothetical protein J0L53_18915 [Spirochaetes bacterium]|nr:hypothetical protein [Spirochaetota bacterium]
MKFVLPDKNYKILWGMVGVGVISLAAGFVISTDRAWLALLSTGYFILCISLIGLLFAAIQFIAGAKWSVVLRRIPENFIAPLGVAILLIAIVGIAGALHLNHVYEWMDPKIVAHDEILQQKKGYLNVPFFIARLVFYFGIWFLFGHLIRKTSAAQDNAKDAATKLKLVKLSAGYTLFFAYSFMLASIDFVMSLQPHWFTTMFPVYCFANGWFGTLAAIIIILVIVQNNGGLKDVNEEHMHDLGKWQFMSTVFWAYIGFSMHMLTWYANMPEETYLLELRLQGIWKIFTVTLWILHFLIPFFILLSRDVKRTPKRLAKVAWYILFVSFVDIIWVVYGSALGHANGPSKVNTFPVGPLEIGAFLGAVGIFGILFFKAFAKGNEAPTGDIDYETSRHFHQTF